MKEFEYLKEDLVHIIYYEYVSVLRKSKLNTCVPKILCFTLSSIKLFRRFPFFVFSVVKLVLYVYQ